MDIRNRRALKETAAARLDFQAYPPRRLALIHAAVIALAMLALTGLDFYLNQQVNNNVGLSAMGTRSILQTVQTVLRFAVSICMPFWQIGFIYAAIRIARGRQTQPADLAEGFRRFRPVLRLYLTRGLFFILLGVVCSQAGSFFYSFTPMGQQFTEELLAQLPASATASYSALIEASMELLSAMSPQELLAQLWPALAITGAFFAAAAAFFFYCFRFADFIVMDQPGVRGIPALIRSSRLTRRQRFQVFRLDLSFWWYYLLYVLAALLGYADILLSYMNIPLPVSSDAAYFIAYALSLLMQTLLFAVAGGKLHTTWAVAYEALQQPPEDSIPLS